MDKIKQIWLDFLAKALNERARFVLRKYHPLVVGVTGSVGKTSTKEAIYSVIKQKYPVMRNKGNFNNEIGVPLTIIKKSKPVGVLKWMQFIVSSYFNMNYITEYPAYVILELATDKIGDIKYLCEMVKPTIGVVTNVGEAHMEFFGNKKKIVIEKRALIESLPKEGRAILNYDDANVMDMKKKTRAEIMTYGLKNGADVTATNIHIDKNGTSFKLVCGGSVIPVRLNMVGYSFVKSAVAATAVGLSIGMELIDIVEGLQGWESLAGRMRIIEVNFNTTIIDDSYNANPDSMMNAFDSIRLMKIEGRKVAVLGSMWELGKATRGGHLEVGKRAGRLFDVIICVEEYGDIIKEGASKVGMNPDNIYTFSNTKSVIYKIKDIVKKDDLILVKGSQGKNRLEKVVIELMKYPEQAKKLLVRQSREWLNK